MFGLVELLCLKSLKILFLIHTGLQPGDQSAGENQNRFNGFLSGW
jgi:hypothetical protein